MQVGWFGNKIATSRDFGHRPMQEATVGKRVLVIDDHPVYRSGLVALIGGIGGVDDVVEAATGATGEALWRSAHFDLITVDLSLPDADGMDLLRKARAEMRPGAAYVISMHEDRAYLVRAKAEGAAGYFAKTAEMAELSAAIARTLAGAEGFQTAGARLRASPQGEFVTAMASVDTLTATERRVLTLLGRSMTSRAIALALDVSVRTVENHRANMCRKLELRGPHRLLEFALACAPQLDQPATDSSAST